MVTLSGPVPVLIVVVTSARECIVRRIMDSESVAADTAAGK